MKTTEDEGQPYDDSIITIIKDFLKEDEKMVFFDEVHQYSSSRNLFGEKKKELLIHN